MGQVSTEGHATGTAIVYVAEITDKRVELIIDGKSYRLRAGDSVNLSLSTDIRTSTHLTFQEKVVD